MSQSKKETQAIKVYLLRGAWTADGVKIEKGTDYEFPEAQAKELIRSGKAKRTEDM